MNKIVLIIIFLCSIFLFTNCRGNEQKNALNENRVIENNNTIINIENEFYNNNTEESNGLAPWGVWNKTIIPYQEDDIRIRTFSKEEFYEIALSGLFLLKQGREFFHVIKDDFPIVAIQGEYTRIEKYEPVDNGFIFYLVGDGFKHSPEGPKFQDNTRIQVKMNFIDLDECYFEYVSRVDENGFHLSYFPAENVNYKRLRVGVVPRPEVVAN